MKNKTKSSIKLFISTILTVPFLISASLAAPSTFISQTKVGSSTNAITLKIKKPKISKKLTLKALQIQGCWVGETEKNVTVIDANKKKVKFKISKAARAYEFKKLSTVKFPLKATIKFKSDVSVIKNGSAMVAVTAATCAKNAKGKKPEGCDSSLLLQTSNAFDGVACETPADFEENSSLGVIALANGDSLDFQSPSAAPQFTIQGGTFLSDLTDASVIINDVVYSGSALSLANNILSVQGGFYADGKNEVHVYALDSESRQLHGDFEIWAGANTLQVNLVDENHQAVNQAEVTLSLADNPEINQKSSTTNGQVQFTNVPRTTVALSVISSDGRSGFAAATGDQGIVTITLLPLFPESVTANNDLSGGTDGWNVGNAPVAIIDHVEGDPGNGGFSLRNGVVTRDGPPDRDIILRTSGEGMQYMTRTFRTNPKTKMVRVRYRFQTSEYPGGFYGSRYNDYYNVSLRSASGASILDDGSSMNALGQGAFTPSGYTAWRSTSIPVNRSNKANSQGEVVQVSMAVANVADGAYDSRVVVDKIEEGDFAITKGAVFDIDNSQLSFISGDAHPYFDHFTRINGTVTIEGEKDDSVQDLELQLLDGTTVVTTAKLSTQAASKLKKKFGKAGKVEIAAPMLMFKIFPNDTTALNGEDDRSFALRMKATSKKGKTAEFNLGKADLLVLYHGTARYDPRDENVGGDDWLLPSIRTIVNGFSGVTWGDFSNMNGGRFYPHSEHTVGRSADGWIDGYNQMNADTAESLINLLNSTSGRHVQRMYARFSRSSSSPFWNVIRDRKLSNGRPVANVIIPDSEHGTHFHLELSR